ncbi:MAG: amylo-alpha-1,6-glucosidase [Candidatus Aenigmatarchaeota archaeon]
MDILGEGLDSRSYILSGTKSFFHRFCNTGFKNKWCGLWSPPYKFLEYFAFKLNEQWLSPENCVSFSYDEASSSHYFNLGDIIAKEFLFVPNNKGMVCILTIQNKSEEKKNIKLFLEVAVNIRRANENWHERVYSTKVIEKGVMVNSELGSFFFGSIPIGRIELINYYKEHYPSGERQRCFIPCNYYIDLVVDKKSNEDVFFFFSCGKNEEEALNEYSNTTNFFASEYVKKEKKYLEIFSKSRLETGINFVDQLFKWSIVSIEKLGFESDFGFGYFAGYPWFTQFWGRDLGWMIPAIVDYGNFEGAKESLDTLSKFQRKGCIPNIIYMDGRVEYNSVDSTLLWIIALRHYIKNSGDLAFLNEKMKNLVDALKWCENREENGFIKSYPNETWMDSINREGKPIEVQAFWIYALKCAGELFGLVGNSELRKKLKEKSRKLNYFFEENFWKEEKGYYLDNLNNSMETINPIFSVFFEVSKREKKILKKIEEDFFSDFGIACVSRKDKIYDPRGYHTGSAWGWITALTACVEFKNDIDKAMKILNILFNNLNKGCVGAIGEAWNSEDGSSLLKKNGFEEEGACLQGWSSALVIRCIDEYMLGIKPDAITNTIIISPSIKDGMSVFRRKRIGEDYVDIIIKREKNMLDVSYRSTLGKAYRIIKVPNL